MEWIYAHPDLALGIIGPILLAIGYIYRGRAERYDNRREALYLLLGIWHRMTIVSKNSFDEIFDAVFDRLRAKFPQHPMSSEELKAIKSYFTPILTRELRAKALEDFDSLHEAYAKAVKLISKSDPVLAYRLDSASSTKKRLAYLESYMTEAFKPLDQRGMEAAAFADNLREGLSTHAEKNATAEIEKSLRGLALHVSTYTYFSIYLLILRRHKKLHAVDPVRIEQLLNEVLIPALGDPSKWFKPTVSPQLCSDELPA
jgi:hypothetical protein